MPIDHRFTWFANPYRTGLTEALSWNQERTFRVEYLAACTAVMLPPEG
jgi:hypothetical protein